MCEACLFCIYPLSAAVCTVLFPRTPEHSRRPPSNPEPQRRGPHVHICKGDTLRFKLFARYYACLLDLGCRENKVPVGGLGGSTAPTTDAPTFLARSGQREGGFQRRERDCCVFQGYLVFVTEPGKLLCLRPESGFSETKGEHPANSSPSSCSRHWRSS